MTQEEHLERRAGLPLRGPLHNLALTFEAFHDTHHEAWLRFAQTQTGSRADAEQIVAEVCRQLATAWVLALRQESVQQYAWSLLKE